MTNILTIHLPVPVPAIKTISRWRVGVSTNVYRPYARARASVTSTGVRAAGCVAVRRKRPGQ